MAVNLFDYIAKRIIKQAEKLDSEFLNMTNFQIKLFGYVDYPRFNYYLSKGYYFISTNTTINKKTGKRITKRYLLASQIPEAAKQIAWDERRQGKAIRRRRAV